MADELPPDEPPSPQPQPPQPPTETVSQAHDKYFRGVFSNTRYAASLLRPNLPKPVVDLLQWASLTHVPGRFVSDDWHGREVDLLFSVKQRGAGGPPVLVYVLLEHPSKPDRWMPLRVLNYCLQVWLKWQRDNENAEKLPLIAPVVFYQGKEPWLFTREFAELVEGAEGERGWVPKFEHLLIDQTELRPEAVVGEPVARLALVAMMAIARDAPDELLDQTVRLMVEVSPAGEVEVLAQHVEYMLAATRSQERREAFAATLRRHLPGRGGELMNYVEQIEARGRQAGLQEGELKGRQAGREEGREEGRLEERVRNIESLRRAGVPWRLIESATGVDEARLRALKEQLPASSVANGAKDTE